MGRSLAILALLGTLLPGAATAQDWPFELGPDGLPPAPFIFPPWTGPVSGTAPAGRGSVSETAPAGPAAPPLDTSAAAATDRAAALVAELQRIQSNLTRTRYVHEIIVSESHGIYNWDCSGMMQWLFARVSPRAFRAIGYRRPLARHWARAIAAAPRGRAARGWENVGRVTEARPGDIFAWRRPRGMPGLDTGHVGIVMSAPAPVPGLERGYAVRIVDATRHGHQDDTRDDEGPGGFGSGTIVFLVDEDGVGTHYGWRGTESEYYVTTPIEIGRVH